MAIRSETFFKWICRSHRDGGTAIAQLTHSGIVSQIYDDAMTDQIDMGGANWEKKKIAHKHLHGTRSFRVLTAAMWGDPLTSFGEDCTFVA